jgi:hypothetical protein
MGHVEAAEIDVDGRTLRTSRFVQDGESPADEFDLLLSGVQEGQAARSAAARFLEVALAEGPVPSTELMEAAKKQGHAWRTVRRAATQLDVQKDPVRTKKGTAQQWVWSLPGREVSE